MIEIRIHQIVCGRSLILQFYSCRSGMARGKFHKKLCNFEIQKYGQINFMYPFSHAGSHIKVFYIPRLTLRQMDQLSGANYTEQSSK